jgi:hypothetical protein
MGRWRMYQPARLGGKGTTGFTHGVDILKGLEGIGLVG